MKSTLIAIFAMFIFHFASAQTNPQVVFQDGYFNYTANTYVDAYYKTVSNNTNWDNFSTVGNINPFTGIEGSKPRDYSADALNYGQGQTIFTGSRGGQYYFNDRGNKVYVPKR